MRLKNVPKKLYNPDGELFGILVHEGFESFKFKGRILKVPLCYYLGKGSLEGQDFTTGLSDTLWLCLLYDSFIRSGGAMKELSKDAVGMYKKFKFGHKPTWLKNHSKPQQTK